MNNTTALYWMGSHRQYRMETQPSHGALVQKYQHGQRLHNEQAGISHTGVYINVWHRNDAGHCGVVTQGSCTEVISSFEGIQHCELLHLVSHNSAQFLLILIQEGDFKYPISETIINCKDTKNGPNWGHITQPRTHVTSG